MQVRWEHLTPPDFKKLAAEEKLCVLPIGSLERHGDHIPFGTDAIVSHDIAVKAAQLEPCVVFPPYWFGQVHEASCFAGSINFPTDFLCKMLEYVVDEIARNGFEKILIVSGHGGNFNWLQYFIRSQCERDVDYSLYSTFAYGEGRFSRLDIWETTTGTHAGERETSISMAAIPGTVKMEYQRHQEPVLARPELAHLGDRLYSGLGWYAKYPENITGEPSAAKREKGELALAAAVEDMADIIRTVKADEKVPELYREFRQRVRDKQRGV